MTTTGDGATQEARAGGPVVLAGYDDEPGGRAAVRAAGQLAERLGGSLHVVYAVPSGSLRVAPGASTGGPGVSATPDLQEQQSRTEVSVRAQVETLLAEQSVDWSLTVQVGSPAEVIDEQAESVDAYMVVVGLRRGGIGKAVDRLLQGSTSRGLERRVERPLVLVPPEAEAA